jgi:hypothetical protein
MRLKAGLAARQVSQIELNSILPQATKMLVDAGAMIE